MKKAVTGILTAVVLSVGFQGNVRAEQLSDGYTLGNSSLNLLNGGILSEEDVSVRDYIGDAGYSSLNVFPNHIYYVSEDNGICRIDRGSGASDVIYQADTEITMMCVVNDSQIYFIQNGNVYTYILPDSSDQVSEMQSPAGEATGICETGDVKGIIPTSYGVLYIRGEAFDWKLYAEDTQVLDQVYQYYTQDGYLVYTKEHVEYQIGLERLFADDFSENDISEVVYEEAPEEEISAYAEEEDVCEVCLRNSQNYSEELYEASQNAAPGAVSDGEISAYAMSDLSAEQQNIVRRAEEQAQAEWSPLQNIKGWNNEFTFEAGKVYKGIPYGQPVDGNFVPYNASIETFLAAARDAGSKLYTSRATYNAEAPYYSSDCSCFVSWAWGLGTRQTTRTLATYGNLISSPSIYKLQVGDILLKAGSHTALVEDVVYKNGKLSSVTIIEQTPPYILRTVYGGSSGRTLENFNNLYNLGTDYLVYRSKNVTATNQNSSGDGSGIPVIDGVPVADMDPHVDYQTHAQDYGWQSNYQDGETAGTVGESKRLEAIKITVSNLANVSVSYRAHVQTYGWQNWVKDGALTGTVGESKRLEAVQIKLVGADAEKYDIYYRTHTQTYGWLDWAKNGESAGTEGLSKRLEAIQIVLVQKGGKAPGATMRPFIKAGSDTSIGNGANTNGVPSVLYQTHVQDIGWQGQVKDGAMAGTEGKSKRLEAIRISLANTDGASFIQYRPHVQTYGWQDWSEDGAMAGTEGESKRLEAICIRLSGTVAEEYDIYYRVHIQTYGWLGWAKNGEEAGSEGLSKRLEAIEIKLVKKGERAPGETTGRFVTETGIL